MTNITEYTVNPDNIYLDDVAELSEGLKSTDFRRINAVLVRCVTDIDGKPVERIKASHAVKLATRIIEAVSETDAGN
jgi:hypothetical protein